jgi:hypothetical protein
MNQSDIFRNRPKIEYTTNIPHNQSIRYMIRFDHLDYHKSGYWYQQV